VYIWKAITPLQRTSQFLLLKWKLTGGVSYSCSWSPRDKLFCVIVRASLRSNGMNVLFSILMGMDSPWKCCVLEFKDVWDWQSVDNEKN
jgi:hypothetical protein